MSKTEGRFAQHVYRHPTGPESAIRGFICWKCWKTEGEIVACKKGEICNQSNAVPFEAEVSRTD